MERYEKIEPIDNMESIRRVIERKIRENLPNLIKEEEQNGKKNQETD